MGSISIHGLNKAFGKVDILKGIDLDIVDGEFVVILGPSGCGKSTLLRLIAGLETADAGVIQIAGANVTHMEPKDRGCAMVFQNYALYPHMTVAENIGYGLRVARIPRAECRVRVADIARLVELENLLDRKPAELSGGQRQRVAMARAIIRAPGVFLFDEPLSNLDARLRVQMRHEVRRIHDNVGATSIFVTHDQVEGMTLADRLVVMREGQIEQVGTPAEVYEHPISLYVAEFIGAPAMGVLKAQATGEGRSAMLRNGTRIDIVLDEKQIPDGTDIRLGIRPEDLQFSTNDADLVGNFRFTEELGSARLHHFDFAGDSLSMVTNHKRSLTQGEQASLKVLASDIHVFDAQTGTRI